MPRSQMVIDPPPYSPAGISPENVAYSIGWSSVCTARWLRFGSRGRPRGIAHEASTPSRSSRRSQWSEVAWCSWITNVLFSPRGTGPGAGTGSGVRFRSRIDRYFRSGSFVLTGLGIPGYGQEVRMPLVVVLDCRDRGVMADFWCAALGYGRAPAGPGGR